MTTPRPKWTLVDGLRAAAVVAALGCLYAYDRRIFGMTITLPSFVAGLIGIARRRIIVGGRGGRGRRTYVGFEAVLASLPFLLLGGSLTLLQAAEIWPGFFSRLRFW